MAAKKKLSRDQKRTLKKAKRTPPPRGARTLLPSPSLLQPLHDAGWGNYTVLHHLPQTAKMSEVLWEFLSSWTKIFMHIMILILIDTPLRKPLPATTPSNKPR